MVANERNREQTRLFSGLRGRTCDVSKGVGAAAALKYRTDLRATERKVWQEHEIGAPSESLHIQRVHDALHEQLYDCARVNYNVCVRE